MEVFADVRFPLAGTDRSTAYDQQRGSGGALKTPITTALAVNVRAMESLTGRLRGGSRAGHSKYISARVGD